MASTLIASSLTNALWQWRDYKEFCHGVNGTNNVLYDTVANSAYPGTVANPISSPAGVAHTDDGNPSGMYRLYVSYLITWPNGQQYETGLSAASADVDITAAAKKIAWSSIPLSPYAVYLGGTAATVWRKLYRGPGTGGSLGDIYLVGTIEDNTTTTYTDNMSDSQLANGTASTVDDYAGVAITPAYIEYHYGRLHYISTATGYQYRIYYSDLAAGTTAAATDVLMPLAFPATNWDDIRSSGLGELTLMGMKSWGVYLFLATRDTWIRRQGNDPSSWAYKKTWATIGVAAPHTVDLCNQPPGILALSIMPTGMVGVSLFNGDNSSMISSPKLNKLFADDLNHQYIHTCQGKWDGQYYHLLYPSGQATTPDTWLALDFLRFPDVRVAEWTGISAQCLDVFMGGTSGTLTSGYGIFTGGSDKYVRYHTKGVTESVSPTVQTHDLVGGSPELATVKKTLRRLVYSLDSDGSNVTMTIYVDGTAMTWPDGTTSTTISGSGDTPQFLEGIPPNWKGYKYSIHLTGTSLTTFRLYSPWTMEFDVTR